MLFRISVMLGWLLPCNAVGQELPALQGRLVEVREEEADKVPLAKVKMSIVGVGNDITNDEGYFRIRLSGVGMARDTSSSMPSSRPSLNSEIGCCDCLLQLKVRTGTRFLND
jgi:hypothetical protein